MAMFTSFGHVTYNVTSFILFSTSALFPVVLCLMYLYHSHIIILLYANIDRLVYCAVLYKPKVFQFKVYRKVQKVKVCYNGYAIFPHDFDKRSFSIFINYYKAVLSTIV